MCDRLLKRCPIDICVSVSLLEELDEALKVVGRNLVEYMNENDLWKLLDDEVVIFTLIETGIKEDMELFGGGLSEDERNKIISWHDSKYSNCRFESH